MGAACVDPENSPTHTRRCVPREQQCREKRPACTRSSVLQPRQRSAAQSNAYDVNAMTFCTTLS